MPINHREIVADIEEHIQKFGGGFGEWWVGTAKDSRGPFFESHRVAELNDGFIYREAYTPMAAQEARDCLVNECGLHLDLEDVPEPGRIVFVFRRSASPKATQRGAQASVAAPARDFAFPKRAS